MTDQLNPDKFHVLSSVQKKLVFLILSTLFVLVAPLLGYFYYNFAINRPAQTDKETTLEITKGESISQIAQDLYNKGLINSAPLFHFYVIANKQDKNVQAGTYTIKAGASVVDLVELFKHGTNDIKITFLEGWRVEEIARELNQRFSNIDYEDFVKRAKAKEGYLFPDTYFLNENITEQDIIDLLTKTFDEKTAELLTPLSLAKVGLSKNDTVILASLIEREVPKPEDRAIVAGILLKRLKDKELLGVDATIQYIMVPLRVGCKLNSEGICPQKGLSMELNWWPKDLYAEDLEIVSPYNTRKNIGLPPTPIANPGVSAINAVLNPQNTVYYYYISDKEGNMHYAKTLSEHNDNIKKYLN